jgi:hypothetical protein
MRADQTGPTQGSHNGRPPTPAPGEEAQRPHPLERVLELRAGDLVCIHSDLIHSGAPNPRGAVRMYASTYLCRAGLPHRDDFAAPEVRAARAWLHMVARSSQTYSTDTELPMVLVDMENAE